MTHYQIIKPLALLPPREVKNIKVTTDPFEIDFIQKFNAICTGFKIHNHTGSSFTYRINGESDIVDLKSLEEGGDNLQISKIEIFGASNADIFALINRLPILKRYNAVEVG